MTMAEAARERDEGAAARPRGSARRLALRLGAAALVVVALAVLLQPWWLAPLVSARLSASARRPVHVDTMWVTLAGSFEPRVEFRGVRIDNAAWADTHQPMAALRSATAIVSWRSFGEGRPVIALMTLRDGTVDLERRADGLRNWRLGHPEDRGPGRYKLLAIRGENASVRFLHERLALDFTATARPRGAADGPDTASMPTQLDLRGSWRNVPFAVSASTGEALTFLETGRMFRVRGHVDSGAARLDVDGQAADIVHDPRIDARVVLAAPSLAPLAALLGTDRRGDRPLHLEGDLKGEPGRYLLSAAKGRLGESDFAGELGWTRGSERDVVRARLTSESTHLSDLRALAPRAPAKTIEHAAAAASAAAHRDDPTTAAPPPRLLDAELSFAARHLHAKGMPWLQGGRIDASLVDHRLVLSHFDLGVAGGRAQGNASIDVDAVPVRGDAELDLSGVRIESLLGARAAKALLTGTLHGNAALRASGDSAAALLASASGSVDAALSGGTISSLLDAEMGLQGGRVVRSMLSGAEPIAIRCAAAVLEVGHGRARVRTLVLDTDRTRTLGTGSIDLARESLDLVLTPEAKQSGLFILDRSIRVYGPLHDIRHALVPREAVRATAPRGCRPERP